MNLVQVPQNHSQTVRVHVAEDKSGFNVHVAVLVGYCHGRTPAIVHKKKLVKTDQSPQRHHAETPSRLTNMIIKQTSNFQPQSGRRCSFQPATGVGPFQSSTAVIIGTHIMPLPFQLFFSPSAIIFDRYSDPSFGNLNSSILECQKCIIVLPILLIFSCFYVSLVNGIDWKRKEVKKRTGDQRKWCEGRDLF